MISEDTKAMILLNTRIVIEKDSPYKPYTLAEWNKLAKVLSTSSLKRPGALLTASKQDLQNILYLSDDEVDRILVLLNHSRRLGFELERLDSLGIWVLSRADGQYPKHYKTRLKDKAPAVLFGAGEMALLEQPGLAIVGSRNITPEVEMFTEQIGNLAAYHGLIVFSGGARGVDITAMKNAVEGRGCSVGVLANSLEASIKKQEYRNAILKGDMALISPYGSNTGFSVGSAMGRNKLIYCLAEYVVVVSSDFNQGGTWAGAVEAIKNRWLPVFVRHHKNMPEGNAELIKLGAIPFLDPLPTNPLSVKTWLDEQKAIWESSDSQQDSYVQKSLL